jgi:hypothetical protein
MGPSAGLDIQKRDIPLASVGNQTLDYVSPSLDITVTISSRLLYTVGSRFMAGLRSRIFGCKLNRHKISISQTIL